MPAICVEVSFTAAKGAFRITHVKNGKANDDSQVPPVMRIVNVKALQDVLIGREGGAVLAVV